VTTAVARERRIVGSARFMLVSQMDCTGRGEVDDTGVTPRVRETEADG
jgi:hypothetical protein